MSTSYEIDGFSIDLHILNLNYIYYMVLIENEVLCSLGWIFIRQANVLCVNVCVVGHEQFTLPTVS